MSRLPFPAELRPQPHHAERRKGGQHGGTDRDGQQAACDPLWPHIPGGGQGGGGALGQQLLQPGHSGRHPDAGRFLHVPPMNGIHRIHRRVNPQEVSFGGDSSMDAGNMLKPALARGELHAIGATTLDEYRKYIEKDAALERRFQPVMVGEPSVEDTIAILRGLKEKYEIHHGVRVTDSAIVAAAELSNRYISDRFLPDKAIDLMDEAASRLRIEIDSMPEEVDLAERKLTQMQIEEQALMKESDEPSKERLEQLRKDIAAAQESLDKRKAEWKNEKDSIVSVQNLKADIEAAQLEEERATREGDLARASELRFGRIPELQEQLKAATAALEARQAD